MRRRTFLSGAAALSLSPALARLVLAAPGGERNLIVVIARGAWDVTYALDPKAITNTDIQGPAWRRYGQSVPNEYYETYGLESVDQVGNIPYARNDYERESVRTFFEGWHERCLVVNGVEMGSISHDACRLRILTGTDRDYNPDVAAIAGSVYQGGAALGYIDFSGLGHIGDFAPSVGMIGASNQLALLLDRDVDTVSHPSGTPYPLFRQDADPQDLIDAYLDERVARAQTDLARTDADADAMSALADSRVSMAGLRDNAALINENLELGEELTIGGQVDIAVGLLAAGLCRAVLVEADLGWDTHQNNQNQGDKFSDLFSGLGSLANQLDSAGLLDNTLVVVLSEFTRTPKINADDGKDHWPVTSALLFGAGVTGDRVLGATSDDTFEAQPVDLATGAVDLSVDEPPTYANLIAGILWALDIDSEEYLPGVEPYHAIYS